MANKYYYNGKLVRTSEHEYTHVIVNGEGKVLSCTAHPENAVANEKSKVIGSMLSRNYWEKEYKTIKFDIKHNPERYTEGKGAIKKAQVSEPIEIYIDKRIAEMDAWFRERGTYERMEKIHAEPIEKR